MSNLFKNNITVECETQGSAGFDIAANEDTVVKAGETILVHTGLYFDKRIADNLYLAIHSRSGLALKKSVFVLNAPGLVDADYTGEIGVILHNLGKEDFEVRAGDRIAQGVISQHCTHDYVQAKDVVRQGGFGSTGTN